MRLRDMRVNTKHERKKEEKGEKGRKVKQINKMKVYDRQKEEECGYVSEWEPITQRGRDKDEGKER